MNVMTGAAIESRSQSRSYPIRARTTVRARTTTLEKTPATTEMTKKSQTDIDVRPVALETTRAATARNADVEIDSINDAYAFW